MTQLRLAWEALLEAPEVQGVGVQVLVAQQVQPAGSRAGEGQHEKVPQALVEVVREDAVWSKELPLEQRWVLGAREVPKVWTSWYEGPVVAAVPFSLREQRASRAGQLEGAASRDATERQVVRELRAAKERLVFV